MKSFREIIRFIKFIQVNQEALQIESEFKNDAKRAYQKYNFLGRFGVKGNGEDKFNRLKHLIYNYGKFNNILKDNDEDLWL